MIALVQKGFQIAADYYRTYSFDQSRKGAFVVFPDDVREVHRKSFQDMLQCLQEYLDQTEFLIVGHGNETGIPLPVVAKSPADATASLLKKLVGPAEDPASGRKELLDIRADKQMRAFSGPEHLR